MPTLQTCWPDKHLFFGRKRKNPCDNIAKPAPKPLEILHTTHQKPKTETQSPKPKSEKRTPPSDRSTDPDRPAEGGEELRELREPPSGEADGDQSAGGGEQRAARGRKMDVGAAFGFGLSWVGGGGKEEGAFFGMELMYFG